MILSSRIWLIFCICGTLLPWAFFSQWIGQHGIDVPALIQSPFINNIAAGFTADLLLSICMFLIWAYFDAQSNGIGLWWLIIPASCFVGLSLSMPLYFYLRAKKTETMRGAL